ncbi:DNA alkylation repair protein [Cellulomonas humilata]|uniref:3-methyladenine DNA glycosylase AlkD n=1 Tax=Cellulomonas humilata TaxID=144055 RepID=A0ABU0EFV0_9CELL|nr:DNA alkylation repair protein [Cellulomonas humilata]MDQ0373973.1 3-methyladenine DNA glycosylase AlkD [Cellulomonas humilata]
MQASEVLALLQEHASADARAQLGPRYGIHVDEALGVSMADMKRLARPLGRDHALAAELWSTGVYEARVVAGLVDDPAVVTIEQMDSWCADFDSWAICDTVCFTLFDGAPDAWSRLEPWAADEALFVRRASFALLWSLALHDRAAADDSFRAGLDLVEQHATDERPLVSKSISMALRAVGRRSPDLRAAVLSTASRLGDSDSAPARRVGRTALRDFR